MRFGQGGTALDSEKHERRGSVALISNDESPFIVPLLSRCTQRKSSAPSWIVVGWGNHTLNSCLTRRVRLEKGQGSTDLERRMSIYCATAFPLYSTEKQCPPWTERTALDSENRTDVARWAAWHSFKRVKLNDCATASGRCGSGISFPRQLHRP
ncbi:MAG: hypothetical protein JWM11_3006 [Planctomycetaceae bacterium]|nr:hypothetical protein [Planctomycetaceae bacterium]